MSFTDRANRAFESSIGDKMSADEILSTVTALVPPDGSVTLAKMANMATASLLGRNTAGTGIPEVLSEATVSTMLGLAAKAPLASPTFSGTVTIGALSGIINGTAGAIGAAARGTAIADSTNATDVITQLNLLLAFLRARGDIAT